MQKQNVTKSLDNFCLAGISFEKTNTATRGLFAVDDTIYDELALHAKNNNIECYILSTCNRTEIYGFVSNETQLINTLCRQTKKLVDIFKKQAYILKGEDAIKHLYEVASGLNSQILGDYEVSSQVKRAFRKAKDAGLLGTFTERLINSVLQTSRRIKNETELSSGTISVSFAVVKYLQEIPDIQNKNILLLGTGKIGCNTCKNLVSYIGTKNITLINRTEESAKMFAEEQNLFHAPYEMLPHYLKQSDIILVATNAPAPVLLKKDLLQKAQIILDLSIPKNVEEEVKNIPGITVIDVDELSQIPDQTLEFRKKEIPPARAIIDEQMQDFFAWYKMRKHHILLKAMKTKIEQINHKEIKYQHKERQANMEDMKILSSRITQKMVNLFADKLKQANGQTDQYSQMLADIFDIPMKRKNETDH